MLGRLLIELSWASSRLKGNIYTWLDTQNLIEHGQLASGKERREAQMILNHKAAIELLVEQAEGIGFNAFTFFNLHALLADNLLANPSEGCGVGPGGAQRRGAAPAGDGAGAGGGGVDRVVVLALEDLAGLHEGNVMRYRLRLSELWAWWAVQAKAV